MDLAILRNWVKLEVFGKTAEIGLGELGKTKGIWLKKKEGKWHSSRIG